MSDFEYETSVNIDLIDYDFDVTVVACVTPGYPTTWEEPGCDAYAEVYSVLCKGVEIVDLLSEDTMKALDQEAIEEAAEAERDAEYDYADHLYDLMKDERAMNECHV